MEPLFLFFIWFQLFIPATCMLRFFTCMFLFALACLSFLVSLLPAEGWLGAGVGVKVTTEKGTAVRKLVKQ
jgi:hypothetical protein